MAKGTTAMDTQAAETRSMTQTVLELLPNGQQRTAQWCNSGSGVSVCLKTDLHNNQFF